jgi:FkbM family methyltransferase
MSEMYKFYNGKSKILIDYIKHFVLRNYFVSETGEDILIKRYIDINPGRYIDVGAHHPLINSNTYLLYKSGWSGYAIEPQKQFNFLWRMTRKRDKLINAIVSNSKNALLYNYSNTLLATTNTSVADFHNLSKNPIKVWSPQAIKLCDLLPNSLSIYDNFALFIDVEGSELDVLKTIKWYSQKPRVIVVESWTKPWLASNKVNNFLTIKGYQLEAYTGISAIYVATKFINKTKNLASQLSEYLQP